jgi:TatA/E family protein of Tat protein translocase
MDFCEMMLLFLLAFLLFGPKKIPEIARQMGQVIAQLKSASSDLQAKLGLEAALPTQAVSEPAVEAQRQIIVGELPPWRPIRQQAPILRA